MSFIIWLFAKMFLICTSKEGTVAIIIVGIAGVLMLLHYLTIGKDDETSTKDRI